MFYESTIQNDISTIDNYKEKFYYTLMQGNKIDYRFYEACYFGIHYAYLNSFKILDAESNTSFTINKGEFFLSKKATNYSMQSLDNLYTSVITILIEPSYPYNINYSGFNQYTALQDFLKDTNTPYIITDLTNTAKYDKEKIEKIFDAFSNKATAPCLVNPIFIESMAKQVLLFISNHCVNNRLTESHLMTAMKNYIINNLSTANLSKAAEHLNYTSSYLSEYVKKETGQNFTDFITDLRMKKAIELLDKESLPISQISKMTGYSRTSSFIRVFKNMYSITPTEYRNKPTILN